MLEKCSAERTLLKTEGKRVGALELRLFVFSLLIYSYVFPKNVFASCDDGCEDQWSHCTSVLDLEITAVW